MSIFAPPYNFYPRSPCGERRHWQTGQSRTRQFLSTLSLRRATAYSEPVELIERFLSTLSLRRATAIGRRGRAARGNFYPRSPCGERLSYVDRKTAQQNFYPRSPCGERPALLWGEIMSRMISIHALLAESDRAAIPLGSHFSNFYPRSPCGERRIPGGGTGGVDAFLSTLSLRRATICESRRFCR